MRQALAILLALAASACSWPAQAEPVFVTVKGATLELVFGDGEWKCSGTAVGERVILSAAHCFPEGDEVVSTLMANGSLCQITALERDGYDHVLLRVAGCRFPVTVGMGPQPDVGDKVFCWGNPDGFSHQLRFGTIAGYFDSDLVKGRGVTLDFTGYKGDSGAAVFNMDGQVIGVVSTGGYNYRVMGMFPISFTRKQREAMGL